MKRKGPFENSTVEAALRRQVPRQYKYVGGEGYGPNAFYSILFSILSRTLDTTPENAIPRTHTQPITLSILSRSKCRAGPDAQQQLHLLLLLLLLAGQEIDAMKC